MLIATRVLSPFVTERSYRARNSADVAANAAVAVAVAEGGGGRGLEIARSWTMLAQDGAALELADPAVWCGCSYC